jgi:RNA polymerase sigma factor FliA
MPLTTLVSTKLTPRIEKIWREYALTRNVHLRDLLIVHYLPLVHNVARRIAARLPRLVDLDDLIQSGAIGLSIAVERFDSARGILFTTFADKHVRGAILDSLRAADWTPRLVQARSRLVEEKTRLFEMRFGRKPSHAELHADLSKTHPKVAPILRDGTRIQQTSLSRAFLSDDSDRTAAEHTLAAPNTPDPVADAQARELRALITRGLTRGERLVLILYYYENMTMKEIGITLDLSESRVSQMRSAVIRRLKAQVLTRQPWLTALPG